MRTRYLIGNWKTNKNLKDAVSFVEQFQQNKLNYNAKIGIAPVYVHLTEIKKIISDSLLLFAQDANFIESGSYTGTVSFTQLQDIGVNNSIIGHSERRKYYNETSAVINQKLFACLKASMQVVLCIGEALGQEISFLKTDLTNCLNTIDKSLIKNLVIAYEPLWAIGTGKTATPEVANQTIKTIREYINDLYDENVANNISILYGGSVDHNNIQKLAIMEQIDGFLVGKASLEIKNFLEMARVYA